MERGSPQDSISSSLVTPQFLSSLPMETRASDFSSSASCSSSSKPPMWLCDADDELFAVLGYSIKPSDMADVAQKIEHLEQETESSESIVMVDSHENGIRLVHSLIACAEVVQKEDFKLAEVLVKNISFLAVSQAGAMRKVATYFAEALARRIYRLYPVNPDSAFTDLLQMHFYETCPYLKFAHFTANQAILESFAGRDLVHVVDFSMK
ncbi:hypothetical protein SASPL_123573 [Salvia splendens]|uniref:DELLA protein n=1 Tax=Salvia splendens TaxID=180675 RepID=A0A8X8XNG2_SALSN|nr:hypothetical protein SASPL_123573 [Salvia splendens]